MLFIFDRLFSTAAFGLRGSSNNYSKYIQWEIKAYSLSFTVDLLSVIHSRATLGHFDSKFDWIHGTASYTHLHLRIPVDGEWQMDINSIPSHYQGSIIMINASLRPSELSRLENKTQLYRMEMLNVNKTKKNCKTQLVSSADLNAKCAI